MIQHMETTLDIENQKKRQGAVDTSFTNRIQEMEERISGAEDSIEIIDSTVKDNLLFSLISFFVFPPFLPPSLSLFTSPPLPLYPLSFHIYSLREVSC